MSHSFNRSRQTAVLVSIAAVTAFLMGSQLSCGRSRPSPGTFTAYESEPAPTPEMKKGSPDEAGREMPLTRKEETRRNGEPGQSEELIQGEFTQSPHRSVGEGGSTNPPVSLFFYHLDHLGTPRVITDVNGNVVSKHKYLPFGEELSPPPSTNTHEFTGHERDEETGLDYMLARYYSDNLGRFLSTDLLQPLSSDIEVDSQFFANPQLWNKYSYARNNPISFQDPDGLFAPFLHAKDTRWVLQKFAFEEDAIAMVVEANVAQDQDDPKVWIEHSMRNPEMTIGQAMEAQKQFVDGRLDSAVEKGLSDDVSGALTDLGEAAHAVQDEKHGFITRAEHGVRQGLSDVFRSRSAGLASVSRTMDMMNRFKNLFFKQGRKQGLSNKQIKEKWKALQKGDKSKSSSSKKSSGSKK